MNTKQAYMHDSVGWDEKMYHVCARYWLHRPTLNAAAMVIAEWTPLVMLAIITLVSLDGNVGHATTTFRLAGLHWNPAWTSVISAVAARILNEPLSHFFSRARPFEEHVEAPLIWHEGGDAFPSNHATGALALAMPFVVHGFGSGYLLIVLAVLLCGARIYTGLHHLTDVLAGAVTGIGVSLLVMAVIPAA